MKPLAVIIQNIIQYYSIRPLLIFAKAHRPSWQIDLFLYNPADDTTGFKSIHQEVKDIIKKDGFTLARSSAKKSYIVCLAPYQDMFDLRYRYLISYYYGSASSKPSTMSPEQKMRFHAAFLHSTYDANILSVYSQVYLVPNLRIPADLKTSADDADTATVSANSAPEAASHPATLNTTNSAKAPLSASINPTPADPNTTSKPTLLYLPTYGTAGSAQYLAAPLRELKKSYHLLIKGHHGIQHLTSEQSNKDALVEVADEYFTPSADIVSLLRRADVVLSDNSGAIFDALYAKVPVCIAAKNINQSFAGIETLQHQLSRQKVLPHTQHFTAKSLDLLLQKTLNPKTVLLQSETSDRLFPVKSGGAEFWANILDYYLDHKVDQNYIALHDYYTSQNIQNAQEAHQYKTAATGWEERYHRLNEEHKNTVQLYHEAQTRLHQYENGKLYRLATKVYQLKNRQKENT